MERCFPGALALAAGRPFFSWAFSPDKLEDGFRASNVRGDSSKWSAASRLSRSECISVASPGCFAERLTVSCLTGQNIGRKEPETTRVFSPSEWLMHELGNPLLRAGGMAFAMFWEILWALVLGFSLSGVVQAVVSKKQMRKLLPDDSPRSLLIACGLGA